MRKIHKWAAAAVLGAVVVVLAFASPAFSDKPAAKDKPLTLKGQLAADTKLAEEDVAKVLAALGPAVRDRIAAGEKVELPGLGMIRVVRIPEHRDMADGKPVRVAANNYVDFAPVPGLVEASNAPDAVPQEVVPPFEFNPLPGQTKSLHVPDDRMPTIRIR